MRAFAVSNMEDWNSIYQYMLHQGAWWYPQEDVYTYMGTVVKVFYISPHSPHLSYLLMKYKLKDFTAILANYHKTGLVLIK